MSRVPKAPEKWRSPYRYATSLDAWAAFEAAMNKYWGEVEAIGEKASAEGVDAETLADARRWFEAQGQPSHIDGHMGGPPVWDCAACGPEPHGPARQYGALIESIEHPASMMESEVPGTCLMCGEDVEWLYHWCFDASGSAFGVCRRCRGIYDGELASEYLARKMREKTDGAPAEG